MTTEYCQDRDLLGIEPVLYVGSGLPSQILASGASGQVSGVSFTATGATFESAQVAPGMVLSVYSSTPSEGKAYEITAVGSQTLLSISVLRPDADGPAIAPPSQSNVSYLIRTYSPQIRNITALLGEKLRRISETEKVAAADYADSAQLRLVAAYGVLADVFVARAENAEAGDANWIKASHYRQLFRQLQLQLRLAVDADGDGLAEQTRSLANVLLRRA